MINQENIKSTYMETSCQLELVLPALPSLSDTSKRLENVRNCDIFVDDFTYYMYADVHIFKFHSKHQFDMKDMKNLIIQYSATTRTYSVRLPCLQDSDELKLENVEKVAFEKSKLKDDECDIDLWKLKRITEQCQLQLEENAELLHFESNFNYGFASKLKGSVRCDDCDDLSSICRMPEPHLNSPLKRSIDREIDELKDFSHEQYKLNFVELQVPEGHDNPLMYTFNYNDHKLSKDEECLLHNLTCKPEHFVMPSTYDIAEIDCGLADLLLAICYDIRSTSNDPTCESGWTRTMLSATLTYFEPFNSTKETVISFLRRSLIYPLYRNYDLSQMCVQDAIKALQKGRAWILKQLLVTHGLLLEKPIFNRCYIEDYIRYIHNDTYCSQSHLQMLARNLKNVLHDISKKHLRLGLGEIETELLKELIADIHAGAASTSEDESSEDDCDNADDGQDSETSSASESEENSVIERRLNALQL